MEGRGLTAIIVRRATRGRGTRIARLNFSISLVPVPMLILLSSLIVVPRQIAHLATIILCTIRRLGDRVARSRQRSRSKAEVVWVHRRIQIIKIVDVIYRLVSRPSQVVDEED